MANTTTKSTSQKTYRVLALLLLFGGVAYFFMVSKTGFKFTVAPHPYAYRPAHRTNLMLEHSNNTTEQKTFHEQSGKIEIRRFKSLQESAAPSLKMKNWTLSKPNPINNQTQKNNNNIVLIVAYMRTGSTLTASLLQEYPKTFYVFEPIRSVVEAFNKLRKSNDTDFTMKYLHNKERTFTEPDEMDVVLDEINAWLTCQLDSISIRSLTDTFHKYYTKIMKNFYYCFKGYSSQVKIQQSQPRVQPQLRQYFDNRKSIDTCLKSSINSCKTSPLRVMKFIRLRMREAMKLLPLYPNMKIIHLVRDPRGILNSRLHVNAVNAKKYQDNVNGLCKAFKEDLGYTKALLKSYPDRIKILHYEDMAERPIAVAEEVAKFSGIEFTKTMQSFIQKQTSSSRDSCSYCTQRKNSTATANKWRSQLTSEQTKYIYNACRMTNEVLGYLPFGSMKEQTDASKSSRKVVDTRNVLLSNDNF